MGRTRKKAEPESRKTFGEVQEGDVIVVSGAARRVVKVEPKALDPNYVRVFTADDRQWVRGARDFVTVKEAADVN